MGNFVNRIMFWRARRTTIIAVGSFGFLVGIGLVQLGVHIFGWTCLLVLLLLPLCANKKLVIAGASVAAIGLVLGLWRGGEETTALSGYKNYMQQKVVVVGKVIDDPVYDDKGALDFRLQSVEVNSDKLPGQMRIKTFSFADIRRGDDVSADGKLVDGFGSYQAAIYFATAKVTHKNLDIIEVLRRNFSAGVLSNIPDPQASLGLGFLVGLKSGLPDDLNNQMKALGLTHIVVASGYNLTILVRLARRFFARISKFQTALASFGLMAGFVAVTGFSPSMSRAALVTGLAIWAWYYGRRIHPVTLLLLAAAITTAINPLFLWNDIGWWLSFLAFAGVMILAPLLQKRIFGKTQPKLIGQVVLETICAQVLTLPLILFVFGNFSAMALLANVLVVPLVPIAMLFTFLGGLAGLVAPSIAGLIAAPATAILSFITEIVGLMAQIPWAVVPIAVALPVMLGLYLLILAIGWLIYRRTKFSFLRVSVVE